MAPNKNKIHSIFPFFPLPPWGAGGGGGVLGLWGLPWAVTVICACIGGPSCWFALPRQWCSWSRGTACSDAIGPTVYEPFGGSRVGRRIILSTPAWARDSLAPAPRLPRTRLGLWWTREYTGFPYLLIIAVDRPSGSLTGRVLRTVLEVPYSRTLIN